MDYERFAKYGAHLRNTVIPFAISLCNDQFCRDSFEYLSRDLVWASPEMVPELTERFVQICNKYLLNIEKSDKVKLQDLIERI